MFTAASGACEKKTAVRFNIRSEASMAENPRATALHIAWISEVTYRLLEGTETLHFAITFQDTDTLQRCRHFQYRI